MLSIGVIEPDGSILNGTFDLFQDNFLGLCLQFKDYDEKTSTFIMDQDSYLNQLLNIEDNILIEYLNNRITVLEKSILEWDDILNNPPPERDALEGYYKLQGSLEELLNIKLKFMSKDSINVC